MCHDILQNVNRPIKLESRIHTVIKRDPRRSDDYPVEEEKKEIAVVDGADINIVSTDSDTESFTDSILFKEIKNL